MDNFIIRRNDHFDFSSDDYIKLFNRSDATAFQDPFWLYHLYETLSPRSSAKSIVIEGRSKDGDLAFILPLLIRNLRGLRLIEAADIGVSDYCCPVINLDYWEAVSICEKLSESVMDLLPAYDILRIRHTLTEYQYKWDIFIKSKSFLKETCSNMVYLPENFDQWRGQIKKSFQKDLDRKRNRIKQEGIVEFVKVLEPKIARESIKTISQFRKGRFDKDLLQVPEFCEFYADIAEYGIVNGFSTVYALQVDGNKIAIALGVRDNKCFRYILLGCEYEKYGRYSPGLLLFESIIADCIANGDSVFDFTIGNEGFKKLFGAQQKKIYSVERPGSVIGYATISMYYTLQYLRKKIISYKTYMRGKQLRKI